MKPKPQKKLKKSSAKSMPKKQLKQPVEPLSKSKLTAKIMEVISQTPFSTHLRPNSNENSNKTKSDQSKKPDPNQLNKLIDSILPTIEKIFSTFKPGQLDGFEIQLQQNPGKLVYIGGLSPSPNEAYVTAQIKKILDTSYSDELGFVFSAIHSKNFATAQAIARVVSEMRSRDKQELENNLITVLKQFREGAQYTG